MEETNRLQFQAEHELCHVRQIQSDNVHAGVAAEQRVSVDLGTRENGCANVDLRTVLAPSFLIDPKNAVRFDLFQLGVQTDALKQVASDELAERLQGFHADEVNGTGHFRQGCGKKNCGNLHWGVSCG